jgi:hypothetical protein
MGINALREPSCIVHAGRAAAQSTYCVEKGILFVLIDICETIGLRGKNVQE